MQLGPVAFSIALIFAVGCASEGPGPGTGGATGDGSDDGATGGANGEGTGGHASGGRASGGSASGGRASGGSASGGSASGGSASGGEGPGSGGAGTCTPSADCNPEPLPSSGDVHQDCVDRVNQFRTGCWCEEPLLRWTEGEDCADEQAAYDADRDTPHAGFSAGICESGFGQNECPGWGSEEQIVEGCLQMMYDEGPPPSASCEGPCFQEHGHFINMTNPDYGRVACGFHTTSSGEVWSTQNFAN